MPAPRPVGSRKDARRERASYPGEATPEAAVLLLVLAACAPPTADTGFAELSGEPIAPVDERVAVATTPTFAAPTEVTGSAELGCRVADAGDVNGDGYGDLLVSDCHARAVHVFHGAEGGIATTPTTTLVGAGGGRFGHTIDGGGDLNGDGYDDVVVGAPRARGGRGCLYVYYGSAAGLTDTTTPLRCGGATTDTMGGNVAIVGDVNGDGLADLAWAPMSGTTGNLRVHHGATTGVSAVASRSISLSGYVNGNGEGLRGAGDVNGDGYDDVVLGAPGVDANAGSLTLWFGSAAGVHPANTQRSDIADTYGAWTYYAGWSVDGAGDVDGDGYGDVLVGYPYDTGGVALLWGGPTGVSWADAAFPNPDAGEWLYGVGVGLSVSGGADFNADGYADFATGLPGYWGDLGWGAVAAWVGDPDFDSAAAWQGASSTISVGASVAVLGDVNGDGCDDLAAGYGSYAEGNVTDYPTMTVGYGFVVYPGTGCPAAHEGDDATR